MIGSNKKVSESFCIKALKMADNERGKPTDREKIKFLVFNHQ